MTKKKNMFKRVLAVVLILVGLVLIVLGVKNIMSKSDSNNSEVKNQEEEVRKITGTKYTTTINDNGESTIVIREGEEIDNSINLFDNSDQAMENFKKLSGNVDRPFCLKEVIEENIIKESYIEFVITEELAKANKNMTIGSYSLTGVGNDSFYDANKKILETAFGTNNCVISDSSIICTVNDLKGEAYTSGNIYIGDKKYECMIFLGASQCYEKTA